MRGDVYGLVADDRAWDTLLLARLLKLGTEGAAEGRFSLDDCARRPLNVELPKQIVDAAGRDVRTGFGRFLHKPISAIPPDSLRYAADDAVATWALFHEPQRRIRELRRNRRETFGDPVDEALIAAWATYRPLSHHVQLRSAILCDVLRRNGVAAERDRVRAELSGSTYGEPPVPFVAEGAGSGLSLQALLDDLHARRPDLPAVRTEAGRWSTEESALRDLEHAEPLLGKLLELRKLTKPEETYFGPLSRADDRVHARFWPLKNSGRLSSSGPNLQNLPRPTDGAPSVRACLAPKPGHVLLAVDYAQVELCVLAAVLADQLKLGGSLAELINGGADLHRRIAAAVLNKPEGEVTKTERQGAKADPL